MLFCTHFVLGLNAGIILVGNGQNLNFYSCKKSLYIAWASFCNEESKAKQTTCNCKIIFGNNLSWKHLHMKATPDLHLTYRGNQGLV